MAPTDASRLTNMQASNHDTNKRARPCSGSGALSFRPAADCLSCRPQEHHQRRHRLSHRQAHLLPERSARGWRQQITRRSRNQGWRDASYARPSRSNAQSTPTTAAAATERRQGWPDQTKHDVVGTNRDSPPIHPRKRSSIAPDPAGRPRNGRRNQ